MNNHNAAACFNSFVIARANVLQGTVELTVRAVPLFPGIAVEGHFYVGGNANAVEHLAVGKAQRMGM